jgi:hypothetical protein
MSPPGLAAPVLGSRLVGSNTGSNRRTGQLGRRNAMLAWCDGISGQDPTTRPTRTASTGTRSR